MEPEQNQDAPRSGAASNLDDLLSQLIVPVQYQPEVGKIRTEFISWLAQSNRETRTDCAPGENSPVIDPLTLIDRQIIADLEERFDAMVSMAGGSHLSATVLGRFSYTNDQDQHVRSFLVQLVDESGIFNLYDSSTGSINATGGAALAEVVLFPSDRVSLRQLFSAEVVTHELGQILSDWPAYFRLSDDRKTSPLLSAAWASVRERHEAFQQSITPDNVRLYTGIQPGTYYLRFDADMESCVIAISFKEKGLNPSFSDYVFERPLLDAGLTQLRAVQNEFGQWSLDPDPMISPQDKDIFSTTIHQLTHRRRDFDSCLVNPFTPRYEMPLINERLVKLFFQRAGEDGADASSQIDHLEMLTRDGRDSPVQDDRYVVGVVAAARDGRFVLNTLHTRCLFEFGPAGVILTSSGYQIDRVMPFYSQAAFREELGRLSNVDREDVPRMSRESYLLHLASNSFSGISVQNPGSIERLSVSYPEPDRNRALIHVHDVEGRSVSTLIERSSDTGIVSLAPQVPRRLFRFPGQ